MLRPVDERTGLHPLGRSADPPTAQRDALLESNREETSTDATPDSAVGDYERLPPLYQRWIEECLTDPIPREERATCSDCAMCSANAARTIEPFKPNVKCCSFVPDLPNFIVGQILAEPAPRQSQGRASILARVYQRVGVGPLGVAPPPTYTLTYKAAQEQNDESFGRSVALRCPHFVEADGGQCGIWAHRNAVCATYFCKHNRGMTGKAFWIDLRQLLRCVEIELSLWCAMEVGINADTLRRILLSPTSSGVMSLKAELVDGEAEKRSRDIWGAWFGREEQFFIACAERIAGLVWSDVRRIGGSRLDACVAVMRESFRELLSTSLPTRVVAARVSTYPVNGEVTLVETYSRLDSLPVSQKVLDLLHYFDGSPVHEVLSRIEETENTVLDLDLIRALLDFQVLKALESP